MGRERERWGGGRGGVRLRETERGDGERERGLERSRRKG